MTESREDLTFGYYEDVDPQGLYGEGGPEVPSSIGTIEQHWCTYCGEDVVVPIPGEPWNSETTNIHQCTPREGYPTPPFDATAHRGQDAYLHEIYTFYQNRSDVQPHVVEEPVDDWDR